MKKIMSLILVMAMLISMLVIPATVGAATVTEVIGGTFYGSEGWSGAGTVSSGVLTMTGTAANAMGRVIHFSKLDSSADWSDTSNSNTILAMRSNDHVIKTRMTLDSIAASDVTSQIYLVNDANGYSAATHLVQLKSNSTSTFDVYVHDVTSATNPSTGNVLGNRNEPATKVLSNVAAGTWVDVMINLHNDGAGVDYYINGVNVGTATFTGNTPRNTTGLRLRVSPGSVAGTQAKFDNFKMTSVLVSGGKIGYEMTSVDYANGKITMNFATEVLNDIKSGIKVNGNYVNANSVTILPGRKAVEVPFNGTLKNVVLDDGLYDVWGSASSGIRYDASLKRYTWAPYEDFSNWSTTVNNWTNGTAGVIPTHADRFELVTEEDGNKYLKILRSPQGGMYRINKFASSDIQTLMATGNYKLLIKAKVGVSADTTSGLAEISTAAGASTDKKLFEFIALENGKVSPKVHSEASFPEFQVDPGEWIDVLIVGDVSGGNGIWNYYLNGEKVEGETAFTYTPASTINSVQFGQRTSEALFDNLEIYITDNAPDFEVLNVTTDDQDVVITFSTEITNEVKDYILWNNKTVADSRMVIDDTKTKLILKKPAYNYMYGFYYPLTIKAGAKSAMGSYLLEDYSCSINSLGTVDTSDVQVYVSNDIVYENLEYKINLSTSNRTGISQNANVILAGYSDGVLVNVESQPLTINASSGTVNATPSFTAEEAYDDVKLFVWDAYTGVPYLVTDGSYFDINEVNEAGLDDGL